MVTLGDGDGDGAWILRDEGGIRLGMGFVGDTVGAGDFTVARLAHGGRGTIL